MKRSNAGFSIQLLLLYCCLATFTLSCRKDNPDDNKPNIIEEEKLNTIPEFYNEAIASDYGKTAPAFTLIAGSGQKINIPQDLDFHPTRANELWVLNKDNENTGGSTVTITDAGGPNQKAVHLRDGNAWHFMPLPTALAFSENGNWATSSGIFSANHNNDPFTGPALWSSDMSVYAQPSGGNGSHLDMLHQSPYGMGIASEKDNVFWLFDGYHGNIVRYDFAHDHGPGNDDHSDGKVHRYTQAKVKKSDIPSHLVLDKNSGWLYVASAADGKIFRLNIKTGARFRDLQPAYEPLAEYWEMQGAQWEVFAEGNITKPCGIEVREKRLFVSDYETGDIIAYNIENKTELGRIKTSKKGITGIKVSPDGKLWFVNSITNELFRVDPQ